MSARAATALVASVLGVAGCDCGALVALDEFACESDLDCGAGRACLASRSGRTYCAIPACDADADCAALSETCVEAYCDPAGVCGRRPRLDGEPCDDGLFCTTPDYCTAGVCAGDPRPCGLTGCEVGCDEAADTCAGKGPPPGSPCNDGDFCTVGETCDVGGLCRDGVPRDCSAFAGACLDAYCDGAAARCTTTPLADGTACDDGLFCTQSDVCATGACVGLARACPSADSCQVGSCEEASAACVFAPAPDGTSCDGDYFCSNGDTCSAGACVPGPARPCPTAACNAPGCVEATDACTLTPLPNGTACDDGTPLTGPDACLGGVCVGGVLDADGDGSPATLDCDDSNPDESPLLEEGGGTGSCNPSNQNCWGTCNDGDDNDCDGDTDEGDVDC